jgi:acetyl esterase/lipase
MARTIFQWVICLFAFIVLCSTAWAADDNRGMTAPNISQPGKMMPPEQMGPKTVEVPKNIQLDRDIDFATTNGHELKLDIAYPKDNKGKLPAIVYIHGGGWAGGDKPTDHRVHQ